MSIHNVSDNSTELCRCLIGIHLLGNAMSSVIRYTTVSGAGLMDPSLTLYSSAIKIDYNIHTLDHITVQDNLADGVLVSTSFSLVYYLCVCCRQVLSLSASVHLNNYC